MLHALLEHRESRNEGIWIDRFCIKQEDEEDKRLAVGSMDLFYKSARKTIVALEDVGLTELEENALKAFLTDDIVPEGNLDTLSRIRIRILSARWFTRAWCCHELLLSRDLVFLLAVRGHPIEMRLSELELLYSETADFIDQSEELAKKMNDVYMSYDFITRKIERDEGRRQQKTLITEFSDIQQLGCTSQSDVLCIAMNVNDLQAYFTGSMKSSDHCRWILFMIAYCTGDASALGGDDQALQEYEGDSKQSSWLNWVTDMSNMATDLGLPKLCEPSGISLLDYSQVTIDLIEFSSCNLHDPSEEWLLISQILVWTLHNIYKEEESISQPIWMQHVLPHEDFSRNERFITEIIACSLTCGQRWVLEQASLIPGLSDKYWSICSTFGPRFWPLFEQIVLHRQSPSFRVSEDMNNQMRQKLILYFFFMPFDSPLGSGDIPHSRMQAPPTEFADCGQSEWRLVKCSILDMGPTEMAIVASRPETNSTSQMKMPIALNKISCLPVRRLWKVEKIEEDQQPQTGRIVNRLFLFTMKRIEESAFVIQKDDQIIRETVSASISL